MMSRGLWFVVFIFLLVPGGQTRADLLELARTPPPLAGISFLESHIRVSPEGSHIYLYRVQVDDQANWQIEEIVEGGKVQRVFVGVDGDLWTEVPGFNVVLRETSPGTIWNVLNSTRSLGDLWTPVEKGSYTLSDRKVRAIVFTGPWAQRQVVRWLDESTGLVLKEERYSNGELVSISVKMDIDWDYQAEIQRPQIRERSVSQDRNHWLFLLHWDGIEPPFPILFPLGLPYDIQFESSDLIQVGEEQVVVHRFSKGGMVFSLFQRVTDTAEEQIRWLERVTVSGQSLGVYEAKVGQILLTLIGDIDTDLAEVVFSRLQWVKR